MLATGDGGQAASRHPTPSQTYWPLRSCKCLPSTVLMSACRDTPRVLASLSSAFTIHSGKSTFTVFFSRLGWRMALVSRKAVIASDGMSSCWS